jgi:hypothetical protein
MAHSPRWAGRFPADGVAEYPARYPGMIGNPGSFSLGKPDAAPGGVECPGRRARQVIRMVIRIVWYCDPVPIVLEREVVADAPR